MSQDPNEEFYSVTGGFPVNQLIITGSVVDPGLVAFVTDAEYDVIEVDFNDENMSISTEGLSYVSLSMDVLKTLMKLEKQAVNVREHIQASMDEAEERGDIHDFTYLLSARRPQYEDGSYVPLGQTPPPRKQDPQEAALQRKIADAHGKNITMKAKDPEDAVRLRRALSATGREVVVVNEFTDPVAATQKNEIAKRFRQASPGTMAVLHIPNMNLQAGLSVASPEDEPMPHKRVNPILSSVLAPADPQQSRERPDPIENPDFDL